MRFWQQLIGINNHKYQKGDEVQLKIPHSCGDTVFILDVLPNNEYKVYIPYFDYFRITDADIIKKVEQ